MERFWAHWCDGQSLPKQRRDFWYIPRHPLVPHFTVLNLAVIRIRPSTYSRRMHLSKAFQNNEAFWSFKEEILRKRRFLWSAAATQFLESVAVTCRHRLKDIPAGQEFWRAQLGYQLLLDTEQGRHVQSPHSEERMKPLTDRAVEGRLNPKGIPCLYFATSREVAMTEVRPWIASTISLGTFEIVRTLSVVDCSKSWTVEGDGTVENAVWEQINQAFSEPIIRSDTTGDYAATQILAEVFKKEKADGVLYKSAFSTEGFNLALFDLDCARLIDCTLFSVRNATFEFSEIATS